jgi:hypothetical protein
MDGYVPLSIFARFTRQGKLVLFRGIFFTTYGFASMAQRNPMFNLPA